MARTDSQEAAPRRRQQLDWKGSILLVLAAALSSACGTGRPSDARPSILLLSIDTLRADHLGTYGYGRDTSPFLDGFAERSLVFEHAFAPAPWTLISHMTMLTGLTPSQHGVVTGNEALADAAPTLAERLEQAGYQTIGLYYEGWIHPRHGFARGFAHFESHANAEEAGAHLARALERLDPDRPFFLFLHLFDVHCGPLEKDRPGPIYDCPEPYASMFEPDAASHLPDMPEGQLWLYKGKLSEEAKSALTALYDGGIRYVDDTLARWFADLDARGILERTLVVVTADHGESLGQRDNGINDHGGAYQEGLHVPLIVRLPGQEEGRRISTPAQLADIAPTLLAAAGLAADPRLPGSDLTAALPTARPIDCENPKAFQIVVRWPHKLVHLVAAERYLQVDLERDPGELVGAPLAPAEFDAARAELEAQLARWPPAQPLEEGASEELTRRLAEMGYAGEGGRDE